MVFAKQRRRLFNNEIGIYIKSKNKVEIGNSKIVIGTYHLKYRVIRFYQILP